MKNFMHVLSFTLSLLFCVNVFANSVVEENSSTEQPDLRKKILTGQEANEFIEALLRSGVEDTKNLPGALNLEAQTIDCREAVVWHPVPKCTVLFEEKVLRVPFAAAKFFFQTLSKQRHLLESGVWESKAGMRRVTAKGIHCMRPVVPNPQGRCTFHIHGGAVSAS